MTAAVIKTSKPYSGVRKAIDLSSSYLEPAVQFNAYKARVIADGGRIINESRLLEEITTMINSGMWGNVGAWIGASFGVKTDSNGAVLKAYGLAGSPDFIPEAVGATARPIVFDTTREQPIFLVRVDKGGSILRSEKKIFAQRAAGADFALSVRGTDWLPYPNDSIGMGAALHSSGVNGLLTWQAMDGFNTRLAWSYTSTATNPVSSGSTLNINKTPYATFKRSAALISPLKGRMSVYADGLLAEAKTHASGKLADINATEVQVNIGPMFNDPASWTANATCYGGISSLRLLIAATERHVQILSTLD